MARSHNYTPEKLRNLETSKLKALYENALRLDAADLVEMCRSELSLRSPRKAKERDQGEHSTNSFVSEYHFVCAKDRGVTPAGPGKFWSGTWVVAQENVEKSLAFGASLALHESKSDVSYRQGKIVEFRRGSRDIIDKENEGIEFLVEETASPLEWVGGGSGEKGYKWEEILKRGSSL